MCDGGGGRGGTQVGTATCRLKREIIGGLAEKSGNSGRGSEHCSNGRRRPRGEITVSARGKILES